MNKSFSSLDLDFKRCFCLNYQMYMKFFVLRDYKKGYNKCLYLLFLLVKPLAYSVIIKGTSGFMSNTLLLDKDSNSNWKLSLTNLVPQIKSNSSLISISPNKKLPFS